jgi:hypothetical protein
VYAKGFLQFDDFGKKNRTTMKGELEQDCQESTASRGLPGQEPRKDSQGRTGRTGQPGEDLD